ncbi:helix-turn-helix transcriptional regulator [Tropicibacter sp. R16_0]|uniref:helix-turn-helix domain-containing protein n=1 Tax=Tropicibacter sp. R16_0 TaxID=2821102 RepID=UPI001ADD4B95|nr:XRE family transcriptional regulator [Tropicibacter sp. R16_0]MBO9449394.1 helix-turn-helix transcriptional regulator [Tropicibacter sp. R16_0]
MEDSAPGPHSAPTLDQTVGAAVKHHRMLAGLTLAELSRQANVSTAMISKIERGQVSASLATLEALATGIDVPLINFFAGTVRWSDMSFVKAGEGMTVQRLGSDFGHVYKMIGRADADHVSFESFDVTLENPLSSRPVYIHRGVEFIHMVEGEMIFRCGDAKYHMCPGDSLSFDSNSAHCPEKLLTDKVRFITVISRAENGQT